MNPCLAASASSSSHVVVVARQQRVVANKGTTTTAARRGAAPSFRRSSSSGSASTSGTTTTKAVAEPDTADLERMAIRTYVLNELDDDERQEILKRPRVDFTSILGTVKPIVDAVSERGDDAVREYTSKFDGVDLDEVVVRVEDLPDPELDADVKARGTAAAHPEFRGPPSFPIHSTRNNTLLSVFHLYSQHHHCLDF